MKKISIISVVLLGLCSAGAFDTQNVSVSSSVKFEGENSNRGRREGQKIVFPHLEISYDAFESSNIYAGIEARICTGEWNFFNDVSPFLGFTFDAISNLTIDCGYKGHIYPVIPKESTYKRRANEIYAGVSYDFVVIPSLYFYYVFERKEFTAEGKLNYTVDLSSRMTSGLSVDLEAKIGYDVSSKPYSVNYVDAMGSKSYVYYGAAADIVYSLNENVSARAGAAFEGNGAKKEAWPLSAGTFIDSPKNRIWFTTSVDCKF
ncbi:MAG: hypothetical protein LBI56_00745 [Puniceicoccales bacterium]|nr:hypothetical protein [Puniceicoccales bacterium]